MRGFLGLPDRIRVSPAGSVSFADLTVHRTVIQHRFGFESCRTEKASTGALPRCLLFGLPDRIRVSPAGSVSFADLTVHRTVIQHRFGFESCRTEKASTGALPRCLLFGLPDRIRTCDLESRSLTRYPAVPRADALCIIAFFD